MPVAPWTDETVIPWGVHRGMKLKELPVPYLLWLSEQPWIKDYAGLHAYLKTQAPRLKTEKPGDDAEDDFKSYEDYKNYRN